MVTSGTDAPQPVPALSHATRSRDPERQQVLGVIGPRQSGSTTLAKEVSEFARQSLTLDDPNLLAAARADPLGFIRDVDRVVIDEIQRAPGLMLAIMQSVDLDRRPDRFLLTGSADIITAPRMQESMAGRIETVTLLPLSYSERYAPAAARSAQLRQSNSLTGRLVEYLLACSIATSAHTPMRSWVRGWSMPC